MFLLLTQALGSPDATTAPVSSAQTVAQTQSREGTGLIAPNILDRQFTAATKNTVWVTDATLISTSEGWAALCVVLNLFSRRVVGWAMGSSENEELVTLADIHSDCFTT